MNTKGITGIFSPVDVFINAVKEIKKTYPGTMRVYSPVPVHELDEVVGKRETKLRYFTFLGAAAGFVLGWVLTLFTSFEWELITGGKPVASIPAFIIVAFELTILLGALATFVGLFFTSGLPEISIAKEYDSRFSEDKFGIYLEPMEDKVKEMKDFLKKLGAEEVQSAD